MKKTILSSIVVVAALAFVSCDKIFDGLEGDLSKMSAADLTSSEAGLDRLMANLYVNIPMGAYAAGEQSTPNATDCNDPNGNNAYGGGVSGFWDYTIMRDVNTFIVEIGKAKDRGSISADVYNNLLGEALFVRAYYYFGSARVYGGVPIVTEPLDDKFDGDKNEGLYIPRSTEKQTWDFILGELDKAIDLLPSERKSGAYRATKWAALGLKSRVALWAASLCKYWNQAAIASSYKSVSERLTYMEPGDADKYYEQCIDACQKIMDSGKFSLYMPEPANVDEAIKNYSDLFLARHDEEFIFGRSYATGTSSDTNGYFDLQNSPYQTREVITQIWRWGRYNVTLDMVDAYDNYDASFGAVDGTIKTRTDGVENDYVSTPSQTVGKTAIKKTDFIKYDHPYDPFANKDARFKASVVYPGIHFRGMDINIQGGIWKSDGELAIYDESNPSEELNGVTYYALGGATRDQFSAFFWMGNTNDGSWYTTGFGLRKFLDYNKVNTYSQTPWCDIRYTEILLNYCEAMVEKGGTNAGQSKTILNQIRRRAFFKDQRDASLENVLKERRIELAFEDDYPATLWRRRAFFNQERDLKDNPTAGRKHALIPIVVLLDNEAKYIFVRANEYGYDIDRRQGLASFSNLSYYKGIPHYDINDLTPNPIDEQ
ncbi:MAG: RagB/SusD family nutrient uptake outer membrane protein [Bacteroidales bacterium]|nr:RagB/SusD family nutrient uptake outer membrane protein [Bacteroidales bacterium]